MPKSNHLLVTGLVAMRDLQPYIQISNENGIIAQLSVAQARIFTTDILTMIYRTEADAMIHKFFSDQKFPSGANAALMMEFREFRSQLDKEEVEKSEERPED